MPKKYLDYYKEWMEKGELPEPGLCASLPNRLQRLEPFMTVKPTINEQLDLYYTHKFNNAYWGSNSSGAKGHVFTPLRQTILLLCAAINDEF